MAKRRTRTCCFITAYTVNLHSSTCTTSITKQSEIIGSNIDTIICSLRAHWISELNISIKLVCLSAAMLKTLCHYCVLLCTSLLEAVHDMEAIVELYNIKLLSTITRHEKCYPFLKAHLNLFCKQGTRLRPS